MESVRVVVKEETQTEILPVHCVKEERASDLESASVVVKEEPQAEFVAVDCVKEEQATDLDPHPAMMDLMTVWLPDHPVKQECPDDDGGAYLEYGTPLSKVEPKDEITIEDHSISDGEGPDTLTSSSLEGDLLAPSKCSRADLTVYSNGMTENSNQVASRISTLEGFNAEWEFKNDEESSQHHIDDSVSHKEQSMCNSIVDSNYSDQTATIDNKCAQCGECFSTVNELKLHLKLHSNKKTHKCSECGKYFSSSSSLRSHLKIHSAVNDFKCAECGKCFSIIGSLKYHLKVHTGEKDHICAECGKCFTGKGHLKQHLKIHSGQKDHKCAECGKCFTDKSNLQQHLLIHSGEKKYKCSECGKCFTQSGSLRYHLKIHSGEKDYKCLDCGMCFSHSYKLKRHSKTHYGNLVK